MWDIILQLKEDGTTVFLTTQYLEEADQLADTVAVLHEGDIVAVGEAAQLKARIGGEMLELLDGQGEMFEQIATVRYNR